MPDSSTPLTTPTPTSPSEAPSTKSIAAPKEQKVGLLSIINVPQMKVLSYCFKTFELALAQARENFKGVRAVIEEFPERRHPDNGNRERMFRDLAHGELIQIIEVTVGEAVHPVPEGRMPKIIEKMEWP